MRAALAIAGVLAAAAPSRADGVKPQPPPPPSPPDKGAEETATNANLESIAPREGVTISAVLGGSTLVGWGTGNATGRGFSLSARLGHVATPRTIVTFEATFMNMLHAVGNQKFWNTSGNLLAGAQYYTSQSLWVRGSAGLGGFTRTGDPMANSSLLGPAALFGIGLDLVRRRFFTLDLQLTSVAMLNREGVITGFSLGVGVNYY